MKKNIMIIVASIMTFDAVATLPTHVYFVNAFKRPFEVMYKEGAVEKKIRIPANGAQAIKVPMPKQPKEYQQYGKVFEYTLHYPDSPSIYTNNDSWLWFRENSTILTRTTSSTHDVRLRTLLEDSPKDLVIVLEDSGESNTDPYPHVRISNFAKARTRFPKAGLPWGTVEEINKKLYTKGWFFQNISQYPLTIKPDNSIAPGVTLEPKKTTTHIVGTGKTNTFIINSSIVDAKIEIKVLNTINNDKTVECSYVKTDKDGKKTGSPKSVSLEGIFDKPGKQVFVIDVGKVKPAGGISVSWHFM